MESVEVTTARNKLSTLVQLVCEPHGEPVMIYSGNRRAILISAEDLSQLRADLTTRTAKLRACEQQLTVSGA